MWTYRQHATGAEFRNLLKRPQGHLGDLHDERLEHARHYGGGRVARPDVRVNEEQDRAVHVWPDLCPSARGQAGRTSRLSRIQPVDPALQNALAHDLGERLRFPPDELGKGALVHLVDNLGQHSLVPKHLRLKQLGRLGDGGGDRGAFEVVEMGERQEEARLLLVSALKVTAAGSSSATGPSFQFGDAPFFLRSNS